jgi:adhesin/invasin
VRTDDVKRFHPSVIVRNIVMQLNSLAAHRSSAGVAGVRALVAGFTTAGALALTACNDTVSAPESPAPTHIVVVSGSPQMVRAGTSLVAPLQVRVEDQNAKGVAGVYVTFATTANGQFDTDLAVTDSNGVATALYTAGTRAGVDTISAAFSGTTSPALLFVTVEPGDPVQLAPEGPTDQTALPGANLPEPFTIEVMDVYGNPVPGVTVTWSTTGGTLSETTSVTDENGRASVMLTLPVAAGGQVVTAQVENVEPIQFNAFAAGQ